VNPSRPFILRPVATTLAMVAIVLSGVVAYRFLPQSALPQVDYPTIQVSTLYPGASPEVTTSQITAPLERQFGQMPGLNQMWSTSSAGASVITLRFDLALTLDVAEQEVQAAINGAGTFLPADLPSPPIYSKVNPADTPIVTIGLTSRTMPLTRVQDLADTRLAQKLSQVTGVGLVSVTGGQKPAVRVQVNPKSLAALGLSMDDLRTAISNGNVSLAKGSFDGPTRASTIDANDQLKSEEDYRNLIVGWKSGAPIRVRDVADVVNDAQSRTNFPTLRCTDSGVGRCIPGYFFKISFNRRISEATTHFDIEINYIACFYINSFAISLRNQAVDKIISLRTQVFPRYFHRYDIINRLVKRMRATDLHFNVLNLNGKRFD